MPTDRRTEQALIELYAGTLVDGLSAEGGMEAVIAGRRQLDRIIEYHYSNVELGEFADDPTYSPEQRSQVVRTVLEGSQPALVSVVGIMAERREFGNLTKVRSRFNQKVVEKLNTSIVDVTTRVPLDDHLREVIKNKAASELGTDIVLDEHVDETMLGGIIMKANGKRIDASMNTMLSRARSVLKEN